MNHEVAVAQPSDQNIGIMLNLRAWQSPETYSLWHAFQFKTKKDAEKVKDLLQDYGGLKFAPVVLLLATLFLPEEAGKKLSYLFTIAVNNEDHPLYSIDQFPTITAVYNKSALKQSLQSEVEKPGARCWHEAYVISPVRRRAYSKTFLDVEKVDSLENKLRAEDPKRWFHTDNV